MTGGGRSHLPFGTYVEEGPGGYRFLISDGKGLVKDLTEYAAPELRHFWVGSLVESDAPSGQR